MARIEKFKLPNGKIVDAERIEVTQANEHWNTYILDDGSVIKMKLVAKKVVRIVNQYDVEGNPSYFINSTNVLSLDAPDNLKKKAG